MKYFNKGSAVVIAVIVVIVLAIIGGGVWYYVSNKNQSPAGGDQFKDWKTYRNEEYGFEVKYPNNWNINTISENEAVEFMAPGKKMRSIGIFIDNNPKNLSLEEFYNGKNGEELFHGATGGYISLKIDGESAIRFKNVLGLTTGDVIVIPLDKKNIRIDIINDFDTFTQILSTFKFIR